jgi:hypothetical protein
MNRSSPTVYVEWLVVRALLLLVVFGGALTISGLILHWTTGWLPFGGTDIGRVRASDVIWVVSAVLIVTLVAGGAIWLAGARARRR